MSVESKEYRFKMDLKRLEEHKKEMQKEPDKRDPSRIMQPRERIRVRLRCRICGRPRAVFRKFGICRICLRNMASDGLIPGMRKASW